MFGISSLARATAIISLIGAVAACSAAPGAGSIPQTSPIVDASTTPTTSPAPSASPSPSASEVAIPTDFPAASKSAKPRPSISQNDLDAILTSSITLLDLAEDDLAVSVTYIDPDSEEPFDLGSYSLAFTDQQTYQVPPGVYNLEFRQPADSPNGPACKIDLGDGEAYTFASIEGAVAVSRSGERPSDAGELFIATSSLCLE
jgi:hypothetical protein